MTSLLGALGLAISLGALVSGCGTDVINPQDDPRPPTWSYIYPAIIQPSCATASCHSDFTRRSGVNFGYSDEAYFQLVCRHFVLSCPPAGMPDPCNPGQMANTDPTCSSRAVAESQLLHQLNADGAPRMPPDFALPAVDIQLISTWIQMGAKEN
ncbi:MAG TPA: hypothetical protein VHL80_07245 [Polyangia bacterium]|nr:hypothetical protein [Polyangia bacterium]